MMFHPYVWVAGIPPHAHPTHNDSPPARNCQPACWFRCEQARSLTEANG